MKPKSHPRHVPPAGIPDTTTNTEAEQSTAPVATTGDNRTDLRLDEIYRRVSKGDTSVVSEVYWLQMFD